MLGMHKVKLTLGRSSLNICASTTSNCGCRYHGDVVLKSGEYLAL